MPKFYIYNKDGKCDICQLSSNRCSYIKDDGNRCKNQVVMTNPFCWIHSLELFGVRVKESTKFPDQKGLFAERNFSKGEVICPYYGQIERDPGDNRNEPYAIRINKEYLVNADCYRSLGANANSNYPRVDNAELVKRHQDPQTLFGPRLNEPELENLVAQTGQRQTFMAIKAKANIRAGQEIFVDYFTGYAFEDDHINTGYLKNEAEARKKFCRDFEPIPATEEEGGEYFYSAEDAFNAYMAFTVKEIIEHFKSEYGIELQNTKGKSKKELIIEGLRRAHYSQEEEESDRESLPSEEEQNDIVEENPLPVIQTQEHSTEDLPFDRLREELKSLGVDVSKPAYNKRHNLFYMRRYLQQLREADNVISQDDVQGTVVAPSECAGTGLFAWKRFEKGQVVATYSGTVIYIQDASQHDATYIHSLPGTPYVVLGQPSDVHRAPYINDYRNCGKANVKYEVGSAKQRDSAREGQTYTFNVVASRVIEPGEEFFGNYAGGGHFKSSSRIPAQQSESSKKRAERAAKRG